MNECISKIIYYFKTVLDFKLYISTHRRQIEKCDEEDNCKYTINDYKHNEIEIYNLEETIKKIK